MSETTPLDGPWCAEPFIPGCHGQVGWRSGDQGCCICTVNPLHVGGDEMAQKIAELIADAPALRAQNAALRERAERAEAQRTTLLDAMEVVGKIVERLATHPAAPAEKGE